MKIIVGDCIKAMQTLSDASVHCCVTSPPYWGLRDYGHDGQIGLEASMDAYISKLVEVFREVRRVLRDDGTLWLNLGDSYASSGTNGKQNGLNEYAIRERGQAGNGQKTLDRVHGRAPTPSGLKPKDLCGIPWRVALALQADGWWLRQDIIWHKPNPMPESVTDRCTKAHEYIFLLSKSERYYYDSEAVKEPGSGRSSGHKDYKYNDENVPEFRTKMGILKVANTEWHTRNRRSVWTVPTKPFKGAHFATFPPALIEPCIKAGSPEGGIVLDPFGGAGTTGLVAASLNRDAILCELNLEYAAMAAQRIQTNSPLFSSVEMETL